MSVVGEVTSVPGKVVHEMGSGKFWLAAAVLFLVLALVVLYVASARSYVLAKLTAREITAPQTAAPSSPPNLTVVA